MATPLFPPVGVRRLVSVSSLLLGLGAVACGAQSQEASPSRVGDDPGPSVATEEGGAAPSTGLDQIAPVVETAEDQPFELSPLAAQVVPLESAFPERVLPGLAEPVGFAPLAVSIPEIGVGAAPIVPVGLEDNGELEVPSAEAVGWYQFGVGVDGGRGSAVLAAHIAFNGRDGVFRDLADLSVGESITVNREGSDVEYVVSEIAQYGKLELPVDDLFRESGDERLVLITCGGSFNPSLRSYDDNVVAIAYPLG